MKGSLPHAVEILALVIVSGACAKAQTQPTCTSFTVVTRDVLSSVTQGLQAQDAKCFREKTEKKYPSVYYVDISPIVPIVFYICIPPDTYHGTRVVTDKSTESNPINGTITNEKGNVSQIQATQQTTTTRSTAVSYSVEYGIYTLSVERKQPDGKFGVVHTFQQNGPYNTLYGIPLGGRGHHPTHAVIEDAAISGGGLAEVNQSAFPLDK